ncbi:hypothetical protein PIB30_036991, partial [Stylosanthes scabra]|nr:hypothetical protein [Stylosanthes scabra]
MRASPKVSLFNNSHLRGELIRKGLSVRPHLATEGQHHISKRNKEGDPDLSPSLWRRTYLTLEEQRKGSSPSTISLWSHLITNNASGTMPLSLPIQE